MRTSKAIFLVLVLPLELIACGGSDSGSASLPPTTPSPAPSAQVQLAVFADPASSFMTSDVRDVDNQIVQFDMANNALIWTASGERFGGYPVSGNFIGSSRNFQVRFGTRDGERRAYFTETTSATICDIGVIGGQLSITPTVTTVPGS